MRERSAAAGSDAGVFARWLVRITPHSARRTTSIMVCSKTMSGKGVSTISIHPLRLRLGAAVDAARCRCLLSASVILSVSASWKIYKSWRLRVITRVTCNPPKYVIRCVIANIACCTRTYRGQL